MKQEKESPILEEYKKARDNWLEFMIEFKKLGDTEKANLCLENATRIWNLRTQVEEILTLIQELKK